MFRVVCPRCGHVIYESDEERSLVLVLRPHNFSCPRCGARLNPHEARVSVLQA